MKPSAYRDNDYKTPGVRSAACMFRQRKLADQRENVTVPGTVSNVNCFNQFFKSLQCLLKP